MKNFLFFNQWLRGYFTPSGQVMPILCQNDGFIIEIRYNRRLKFYQTKEAIV